MNVNGTGVTFMSKKEKGKKKKFSIQGGVLNDILNDLNYVSELLALPPYAGPRHNFEAQIAQKKWGKMYSGEIKKRRALRDLRKKKWLDARTRGNAVIIKITSDAVVSGLKSRILNGTPVPFRFT